MTDLQIVSMFAGVGGFDLAGQRAGMRTAAICEIDKAARGVLVDRFPEAVHFTDIRSVTADDLRAAGVDPRRCVYCAGFPCQDLSVAGRRAGLGQGTRSGLYWEIDRHLAEFAPEWVFLENVPGLLSATCPCPGDGACQMDGRGPVRCPGELHAVTGGACVGGCIATHGGTMGAVLGSLGNRGYGFAYRVLDAQRFGVPQRRRRVLIVGRLGDDGTAPAQVLAELEGGLGDSAARPEAWARLAQRAGDGARGAGRDVVNALTANMAGAGGGVDDNTAQAGHLAVGFSHTNGVDEMARDELSPPVLAGNDRMPAVATFRKAARAQTNQDDESWTEDDVANTVNTFDVGDTRATELVVGGVMGAVAHTLTHEGSRRVRGRHRARHAGRRQEDDENLTATGSSTVRRLTPRECERLQGFPDDWTATSNGVPQADSPRYKQMGNSVAVPVIEFAMHRLVAVDEAVRSC